MNLRPNDESLLAWQRELETHPMVREWKAVSELLGLRNSVSRDPLPSLSDQVKKVREKETALHLKKKSVADLKDQYLHHMAEIYLSTGNVGLTPSSLVEMLANSGIVPRKGPHWKTAALGRVHQWLKWDKKRFLEVDAERKLWALRPDYYAGLQARSN